MARELMVACQRRALRRKSFPAIAIAARTRHGRVRTDYHAAKFAGGAVLTTIDLTVKDDSRTYAFRHQYEYEIARVTHFRPTKPKFSECHGICVVIQRYRQIRCGRDHSDDRDIVPFAARHINAGTD